MVLNNRFLFSNFVRIKTIIFQDVRYMSKFKQFFVNSVFFPTRTV
jgi:hypothetical protein